MKYKNGDEFEGELNEKGLREGKGKMKYKNGEIYFGEWKDNMKNGIGLLCYNENDYKIIIENINVFTNNFYDLFELNIKHSIYRGQFISDQIEGKGILYDKDNNDFFSKNVIYVGNFKKSEKYNYGIVYFKKNAFFEAYWLDNKTIDEKKEAIFHLNNSIQFKTLNDIISNNLIDFIKTKLYGNIRKSVNKKSLVK